ncbi:MAG: tRNA1(Val) (adenine(37)-N6)-methyltransferase [Syntrophomonadaceae bacterium]
MDKPGVEQINQEETLDDLILGNFSLYQARAGYRFSLDAVLLAHFVNLEKVKRAVDLGTGSGVIATLMAARSPELHLTGLELQQDQVDRARRSVMLNGLQERISILQGDVRQVTEQIDPQSVELVVSNPPFRKKGEGRVSKNSEQAVARHELHGSLGDFVQGAGRLLIAGGRLAMIQRTERFIELMQLFKENQIAPSRLRWVHSFVHSRAGLFLLEGIKNKSTSLEVLPPLIIYDKPKTYSAEILSWYQEKRGTLDG